MAGNIKGLTVEINGETTGLEAALKNVSQATRDIDRELKEVERSLKLDPGNVVLLAQKQDLLREKIEQTKLRLDALRQAQERVKAMYERGEIDEGQYRAFQRDIATTEAQLEQYEGQLREVEQAQEKAGKSTHEWGQKLKELAGKAVAAGLAAGTAFFALGMKVAGTADDLADMARKTGMSTDRLQELAYIGEQVGGDLDTFARAQAKLTRSMDEARDGTGKQAEAFAALGISVVDAHGNLRDAKTVFLEAIDALGKVGSETERDAIAMNLFGRSAMELNPLIVTGAEGLEELARQAHESGAVMSESTVQGLAAFSDGMEALKRSIMATIGEAFNKIMPILQPILDWLLKAPGPVKVLIGVIGALGVGLAALTPVIMAFSAVQWAALAPILAVVAAIGALVAIVVACIKYHEQIKAALIAAWNAIKGAMIAAWNAIKGAAEAVWGAIKSFFSTIWDGLQAAWDAVWGALSGALQAVWGGLKAAGETIWNGLKSFFEAIWNGLQAAWDAVWGAIKSVLERVWNAIKAVADFLWGPIITFFSKVWDDPKAAWDAAWNEIRERLEAAWKAIKGALDAAWQAIKDAWGSMMSWLREIPGKIKGVFADAGSWLIEHGRSVINGLWNGLKNVWETVTGWFKGLGGTVKHLLSDAGSWLVETGKAILRGMWDGIVSMKDWLWNKIKGLRDTIVGWFEGLFGISSPSKVMAELGEFTMQGFAEGLKHALRDVEDTLSLTAAVTTRALAVPSASNAYTNTVYNQQRQITIVVKGNDEVSLARSIALALGRL